RACAQVCPTACVKVATAITRLTLVSWRSGWLIIWQSSAVILHRTPDQDFLMSQAITTENTVTSLTCLAIPLADRTLLIPNVVVAELIPYRAPQPSAGMPAWFLGQINWRDLRLPLLSFEA